MSVSFREMVSNKKVWALFDLKQTDGGEGVWVEKRTGFIFSSEAVLALLEGKASLVNGRIVFYDSDGRLHVEVLRRYTRTLKWWEILGVSPNITVGELIKLWFKSVKLPMLPSGSGGGSIISVDWEGYLGWVANWRKVVQKCADRVPTIGVTIHRKVVRSYECHSLGHSVIQEKHNPNAERMVKAWLDSWAQKPIYETSDQTFAICTYGRICCGPLLVKGKANGAMTLSGSRVVCPQHDIYASEVKRLNDWLHRNGYTGPDLHYTSIYSDYAKIKVNSLEDDS